MNITYFVAVFSCLGLVYLALGLAAARNLKTKTDYYLAGKDLGFISLFATLIATQIGGGLVLGTAEEAYKTGLYGLVYGLGIAVGFLVLGAGFAAKLRKFEVATIAELFEKKFNSPALRKGASIASIISMSGILVGQVVASRRFMLGLGFDMEWLFLAFWAFIIAYTVLGGLKAVVVTDVFQVSFLVVVFAGLFFFSLGDFSIASVAETQTQFEMPTMSFTGLFLLPLCFSLIEQDLAQRCFSARTPRIATLATIASGLFILLFSFIPVYFGIKAHSLGLDIPEGASPFVAVLSHSTSEFVFVLVACGLLAAITSTADSLLCAVSSNVAQDFSLGFLGIKNPITLSKVTTLVVGVLALVIAYRFDNVLEILLRSYELPVSCLFISFLYCCFSEHPNREGALVSFAAGLGSFLLFQVYTPPLPREVVSLALSFVGYQVGSRLSGLRPQTLLTSAPSSS